MKKLVFEDVMVINVLDQPNKDNKVFAKLVVCDHFGHGDRVGIDITQVAKFRAMIGHKISFIAKVWTQQGRDGGTFDTYQLDSIESVKPALKAAA
jgi:hypothetical protein